MLKSKVNSCNEKIKELADIIEYDYNNGNIDYLVDALYCKKNDRSNKNYSNSAQATLGDAILNLVIAERYYHLGLDKGEITKMKEIFASNSYLVSIREKHNILDYRHNDKSVEENRFEMPSGKHDLFIEAIIGAFYLNGGYDAAKKWIIKFILNEKE